MSHDATVDLEQDWTAWIGRDRSVGDSIHLNRVQALQAVLDDAREPLRDGDPLPPLWHWLYFWDITPSSQTGPDGHARRGDFLPPIPLPRRMWAGSRVRFPGDLVIGAPAVRRSVIHDVKLKHGRSGPLAFVTVRHTVEQDGRVVIEDEHDIVYREDQRGGNKPEASPPESPPAAAWQRTVTPDPVLLFRYSALTFNGHRIHYDREYTTMVEGYPGLVVHGPLMATLMLEEARKALPERRVKEFTFRAAAPVFDTAPFSVAGRTVPGTPEAQVWIGRADGVIAMNGLVQLQ